MTPQGSFRDTCPGECTNDPSEPFGVASRRSTLGLAAANRRLVVGANGSRGRGIAVVASTGVPQLSPARPPARSR